MDGLMDGDQDERKKKSLPLLIRQLCWDPYCMETLNVSLPTRDLISELQQPKAIISTTVSLIEALQSSLFIAQISSGLIAAFDVDEK